MEKAKEKKYKSKDERVANATAKKKGRNVELFCQISDCNPADLGIAESYNPLNAAELGKMTGMTIGELCDRLGIKELYFKVAGEEECMRDMSDVEAVMMQNSIVGTCFAYRYVGYRCRAMRQTFGFVDQEQVIVEAGEEHVGEAKSDVELEDAEMSSIGDEINPFDGEQT